MIKREQRVIELRQWAENKGLNVTEEDLKTFDSIIKLATNDGIMTAVRSTEIALKLADKYGADQTMKAIEKGVADLNIDRKE
ncbi:hypothetical protein SporoP37_16735 (plasmid) [Sporosarcina sp. P37]|uniref:hypothetical protein n=1 Tax=unclassified Sporosarcina TaxID=2647733 RepID=UPI000A17F6D4|nr:MULTISPECIES: hypothetical protein [unclassified Sporosarcina]ARK26419.1 hypothetical protein SporoP37_16735 [Sporosarcina sp. P37]PID15338.1 hypothetical protein CSV62_16335 [Sporosarcina sp. P35]